MIKGDGFGNLRPKENIIREEAILITDITLKYCKNDIIAKT
ncbi:MAG: hypothetical protein ACPLYF_02700 [Fervidobacterium sp.]